MPIVIRNVAFLALLGFWACSDGPGAPQEPVTGSIRLRVQTAGHTLDTDGYSLLLDGVGAGHIAAQDSIALSNLAPGSYSLALTGVSSNCAINQPHPLSVTVQGSTSVVAAFQVQCDSALRNVILFTRYDGSGQTLIYSVAPDGTSLTALTAGAWPSPSPDGRQIVFDRSSGLGVRIFRQDVDGHNLTQLTPNGGTNFSPAWSPDGARIAFISLRDGHHELYTMRPDGTDVRRLTFIPIQKHGPSWSPDGLEIVFEQDTDTVFTPGISVIPADGGVSTDITPALSYGACCPQWSPDGTHILINAISQLPILNNDLFIMNTDGTNPVNVTNSPDSDGSAAWAPDGSTIVFDLNPDGAATRSIFRMNVDGSGLTQLTTPIAPALDIGPVWVRE